MIVLLKYVFNALLCQKRGEFAGDIAKLFLAIRFTIQVEEGKFAG